MAYVSKRFAAAGHCRLVVGIPLLSYGEDVKTLLQARKMRVWAVVLDWPCLALAQSQKVISIDEGGSALTKIATLPTIVNNIADATRSPVLDISVQEFYL